MLCFEAPGEITCHFPHLLFCASLAMLTDNIRHFACLMSFHDVVPHTWYIFSISLMLVDLKYLILECCRFGCRFGTNVQDLTKLITPCRSWHNYLPWTFLLIECSFGCIVTGVSHFRLGDSFHGWLNSKCMLSCLQPNYFYIFVNSWTIWFVFCLSNTDYHF